MYPNLPQKFLVTGGRGFLGTNIVRALLQQPSDRVTKIIISDLEPSAKARESVNGDLDALLPPDIRQAKNDGRIVIAYGDLTVDGVLRQALENEVSGSKGKKGKSNEYDGVDCVIHTAAPHPNWPDRAIFDKVNIGGTKQVIQACKDVGVPVLIYTSSASVVWEGTDHAGVTEDEVTYARTFRDHYSSTKAAAEKLVTEAKSASLITISLRPHALFGPGDQQMLPTFVDVARKGKNVFVVGDGNNDVDFTYVGNVVHGHIQAAEAAFKWKKQNSSKDCTKFVANGKPYFITNGEPMPFWQMANWIWLGLGYNSAYLRIPYWFMVNVARIAEFFAYIIGKMVGRTIELQLSSARLQITGTVHYYSIENAEKDLGYRPLWTMQQGVYLMLKSFAHLANPNPPSAATMKKAKDGNLITLGLIQPSGPAAKEAVAAKVNPSSGVASSSATNATVVPSSSVKGKRSGSVKKRT